MSLLIVIASHRRSGTHWTIDTLRHNCGVEEKYINLDRVLPWHNKHVTTDQFSEFASENRLVKTHTPASLSVFEKGGVKNFARNVIDSSRVIYVVRDGRDVMVSLYHYLKHMDTDPGTFSEFLRQDNEFDVDRVNRVDYWAYHVNGWLDRADVVLSYEALHLDYEYTVRSLAECLGLETRGEIADITLGSSKSSAVAPRTGRTGDWEHYFTEEDLEFFNGKAGKIMRELRYI